MLLSFEDELERNNYIEAVASAYKVSKESLEKLVAKTAVSTGLARPVTRPKKADGAVLQKEDGIVTSQKVLLTWMIENESSLFAASLKKAVFPSGEAISNSLSNISRLNINPFLAFRYDFQIPARQDF